MKRVLLALILSSFTWSLQSAWAGQAVLTSGGAPSFEKALRALEKDDSAKAIKLLQKRVEFLKSARTNKWTVADGEPPLTQSMLINYRLKLLEGDIEGALDDFDFMVYDLKIADPKHFAFTLVQQMNFVTIDRKGFLESTKKVARATWFFRSLQQPQIKR